jgi:hypothetical protein
VGLAGLFAFIRLVQAGIMWGGSGGNITSVMEARKIIMNVMFGLALILFSWAILNTINPDILNPDIRLPAPQALLPIPVPPDTAMGLAQQKPAPYTWNVQPQAQPQVQAAILGPGLDTAFSALPLIDVEKDIIQPMLNVLPAKTMVIKVRNAIGVGGSPVGGGLCGTGGAVPDLPASGACVLPSGALGIPDSLGRVFSAAGQALGVPPSLILGLMYGEGVFNPGKYDWTDANVQQWIAEGACMPGCNPNTWPATIPLPWSQAGWEEVANASQTIAPGRQTNHCNLLDNIFAAAYFLSRYQCGSDNWGLTCFGIPLYHGVTDPTCTRLSSCAWSSSASDPGASNVESAIKFWEAGNWKMCLTLENSCLMGGGPSAGCPGDTDTCETVGSRYSDVSHNGCVWDVYYENR